MDFCLHVVEFSVNLIANYALCFPNPEARIGWVRAKLNAEQGEFMVMYTTKEELRKSYSYILGVEYHEIRCLHGCKQRYSFPIVPDP